MLLIWRRWRGWRRGRPFWGGLFTVIAGVEIGVLPLAPVKVMLHQGTAGIPTVVLAVIMVVLGLTGWFTPQYRGLAGIITVILASAALVMSNLGGFMIGTLLGVVGGALMFAWRPVPAADGEPADGHGPAEAVPAQAAAFHAEAPEPARAGSGTAGAAGLPASGGAGSPAGPPASAGPAASASAGPAGSASAAGPSGASRGSSSRGTDAAQQPGSANDSLAAAFGVDDEPFPPPRGSSGPQGRG